MVGLTEFDKDLKPAPVIAKSWELSDGGKKIVFKLRDDVQWSDGKKVRAQDFEYSWKRLLDPKTASQYAYILFDIANAAEYAEGKLKDPAQVGVKRGGRSNSGRHVAPSGRPIFSPSRPSKSPIRSARISSKTIDNRWTEPGKIVTNGPFLLASWKHAE